MPKAKPSPCKTGTPRTPRATRPRTPTAQLLDLSVSVPQVVAHRSARLALAKPVLSARDRKEFTGMVLEKQVAALQSWQGMWMASALAWQRIAFGLLPHSGQPLRPQQITQAASSVLAAGLKPYQQKAAQNAKRLRRTKLV